VTAPTLDPGTALQAVVLVVVILFCSWAAVCGLRALREERRRR
jgi:hypothetical protein